MQPIEQVLSQPNRFAKAGFARDRLKPEAFPHMAPGFKIEPGDTIFTIGSCFARNIEDHLHRMGFRVPMKDFTVPRAEFDGVNPTSIMNKYTPPAIYQEIEFNYRHGKAGKSALAMADIEPLLFDLGDGQVIDTQIGGFFPVTRERALVRRNEIFRLYGELFTSKIVVVTLGLIECWLDQRAGLYIQHLPTAAMRRDEGRFFFDQLGYEASFGYVSRALRMVFDENPDARVLLTTSPIPLIRTYTADDVITANMYSKSVLRAVAGRIAQEFPQVDYFPSFESVMLTRDWSVFQDDMRHVTDEFVGKIMERVVENYVGVSLQSAHHAARKAFKASDMEGVRAALATMSGPLEPELLVMGWRASDRLGDAALKERTFSAIIDYDAVQLAASNKVQNEFSQLLPALYLSGDVAAYEQLLGKLTGAGFDAGLYYLNLSMALQELRQTDEAIEAAGKAVELAPGHVQSRVVLGKLLFRKGRIEQAEEHAREATRLSDKSAVAFALLARILDRKGDAAGALVAAEQAVRIRPESVPLKDLRDQVQKRAMGSDRSQSTNRAEAASPPA